MAWIHFPVERGRRITDEMLNELRDACVERGIRTYLPAALQTGNSASLGRLSSWLGSLQMAIEASFAIPGPIPNQFPGWFWLDHYSGIQDYSFAGLWFKESDSDPGLSSYIPVRSVIDLALGTSGLSTWRTPYGGPSTPVTAEGLNDIYRVLNVMRYKPAYTTWYLAYLAAQSAATYEPLIFDWDQGYLWNDTCQLSIAGLNWGDGSAGDEWSYESHYSYSALNGRASRRIRPFIVTPEAKATELYILAGTIGYNQRPYGYGPPYEGALAPSSCTLQVRCGEAGSTPTWENIGSFGTSLGSLTWSGLRAYDYNNFEYTEAARGLFRSAVTPLQNTLITFHIAEALTPIAGYDLCRDVQNVHDYPGWTYSPWHIGGHVWMPGTAFTAMEYEKQAIPG
jgi:hypothetical protein